MYMQVSFEESDYFTVQGQEVTGQIRRSLFTERSWKPVTFIADSKQIPYNSAVAKTQQEILFFLTIWLHIFSIAHLQAKSKHIAVRESVSCDMLNKYIEKNYTFWDPMELFI